MDNQLKPCPFCGNPDIQRGRAEIGNRPTFHTYCNGCEAGTQGHPTREASDEAWNRRAALAHSDAAQAPLTDGQRSSVELALKALMSAVSVYDVEMADKARAGLRAILAAPVAAAAAAPTRREGSDE